MVMEHMIQKIQIWSRYTKQSLNMQLVQRSMVYFVVPGLLLLMCVPVALYCYHHRLFQLTSSSLAFERYSVTSTDHFSRRFQFKQRLPPSSAFSSRHNLLLVEPNYTIVYENQVDLAHIKWVRQPNGPPHTHLIIQYSQFTQVIYIRQGEGEVCLELEIGEGKSVAYITDGDKNIWIVTAPMDRLLLLQVYSCRSRTLLHKRLETLSQPLQQIVQITDVEGQMHLQAVTYSLSVISINLTDFKVVSTVPAFQITHQSASASYSFYQSTVYQPSQDEPYPPRQPILHFLVEYLTLLFSFQSLEIYHDTRRQPQPLAEPVHISSQFMDTHSNYVLLLDRDSSVLTQLDPYLIATPTPVFHSVPNYDIHTILERPPVQFSYINKQLIRANWSGVFPVYPSNKVHFMAFSPSLLHLYPLNYQQDDYFIVRTKQGGLVSQGVQIKGTYEKIPISLDEVYQVPASQPDEPLVGIYQIHAGYVNLYSILRQNKVELISGAEGKSVFSHFLTYSYTSAMLLNNEWWILQYDAHNRSSIATKYQLYINSSNPTAILHLKAVYGQPHSTDELAILMQQYQQEHAQGYILLSVFRCIDQYYYFEYSSVATHSHYGVARIHYQSLSNRRVKPNGPFAKKMAVSDDMLIKTKTDRSPYAVLLHIPLLKLPNPPFKWYNQCRNKVSFLRLEPTSKSQLAPIRAYSIGQCGSTRKIESQIVMINMRSLIEQAIHEPYSLNRATKRQLNTALALLTVLPIYLLLLICCRRKAAHEKEE